VKETPRVAEPTRAPENVRAPEQAKVVTEQKSAKSAPAEQKQAPTKDVNVSSEDKIVEILGGNVDAVPEDAHIKSGSSLLKVVVALFLIVAIVPLALVQIRFTSPLGPGDGLKAGQFRRKCGITSLTKKEFNDCNELSAEFDDKGVLTVYNLGSMLSDEKTVLYRLMAENTKDMSDDGLVVGADGSLTIGGKRVVVEVLSDSNPVLSPWPFAKEVTLQRKKRKGRSTVWHVA